MTYDAQCRIVDAKIRLEWALKNTHNSDVVLAQAVRAISADILTAMQERITREVTVIQS